MINIQGSKFSANWRNSANLGPILIIPEISVNPLRKKIGGGGVRGLKIDFFDLETMFLAFFRCGRLHYKWEKFLTCYNSFPAFLLAQSGHVGPVFTFYKMAGV